MANKYDPPKEGVSMTIEKNTGAQLGVAGLYRHPESGQEEILITDPLYGDPQVKAYTRIGFVFVREATPDEVKAIAITPASGASINDLKGLQARIDLLENEKRENAQALNDAPVGPVGRGLPDNTTVPGSELAKEAANRSVGNHIANNSALDRPNPTPRQVSQMNSVELKEKALELGVDVEGLDTNSKLRKAIWAEQKKGAK